MTSHLPVAVALTLCLALGATAQAQKPGKALKGSAKLDEMSLERWGKLRETEKYQLNVAEKYWREKNYGVAAAEYEKFLSLYETSEGAPFAQLKWSMCQVQLKKLNTAIKDGYQTLLDYWPDSPEAVAAALLIGRTNKDMGEIEAAKTAYRKVLADYPDELSAVLARDDLAEIARIENDQAGRRALLKELTFDTERKGEAARVCAEAAKLLATLSFSAGSFAEGRDALATNYSEADLPKWVLFYLRDPLAKLAATTDAKPQADKLADDAVAYFREQMSKVGSDDEAKTRAKQLSYDVADVLALAKRGDEATKVYDDLLQKHGNDDDVLAHYGDCLKSLNRREEARQAYGRMKDAVAGRSRIADSFREERKFLLAAPIYQELVAADADHADRWNWLLAESYREGDKHEEAIAAYRLTENYPANLERIGSCYRAQKKFKEAIGMYTQVLGGYPNAASNALLQIGYTQEQAGQKEAAIKTFQQVCKNFPQSGEASAAHAHLQNKYQISVTLGGAKSE